MKDVAYSVFKYKGIGTFFFSMALCFSSSLAQFCTFLPINICFDLKQCVGCKELLT